jgi:Uma2 family endonuclease
MAAGVLVRTTTVSDVVWTIADVERLPSGPRYEVLGGVLYILSPPVWPQPVIGRNLQLVLSLWVRERRLGIVVGAKSGITDGLRSYLDPDVLYLRWDQIPPRGGRPEAAALSVEVMSPSNLRAPREDREEFLFRAGVEELWYVDGAARTLEVRRLGDHGYETVRLYKDAEPVTTLVLPGLEFPLTALWEDLGPE